MDFLTLTLPDDWHLHVRDGAALRDVVPHSAKQFGRALIMPNLRPAVTTLAAALDYRRRVLDAVPAEHRFEPLMTLYLTDATPVDEVRRVAEAPEVLGFKLYPAGATTHSEAGVTDLERIYSTIETMERHDVPLLIHGEVTDPEIDVFDREAFFIERHLAPLVRRFPGLRVVLEHVTTKEGVDFVRSHSRNVAASITAHHLLYNRNTLLTGGIRPHYYCLPVLKRETHRQALIAAATGGDPRFFLGTDSAPHPRSRKENACGCAGCYTALCALELYATAFERAGALHRLEGFASHHGADFYRIARNRGTVTLERVNWTVPEHLPFGREELIPLLAGQPIGWRFHSRAD